MHKDALSHDTKARFTQILPPPNKVRLTHTRTGVCIGAQNYCVTLQRAVSITIPPPPSPFVRQASGSSATAPLPVGAGARSAHAPAKREQPHRILRIQFRNARIYSTPPLSRPPPQVLVQYAPPHARVHEHAQLPVAPATRGSSQAGLLDRLSKTG